MMDEIRAFWDCNALKRIKCAALDPPDITSAFTRGWDTRKDVIAKVPSASLSKYQKNEWWRDFTLEGY